MNEGSGMNWYECEYNKIQEFLQKLALCIERGEPEACVEEAVKLAGEMG